jgi:hypothetical protein
VLAAAPDDPEMLKGVASMRGQVGRFRAGIDLVRRAMTADRSPEASMYAIFLDNVGRYPEARDRIDDILTRWPANEGVVVIALCMAVGNDDWDRFEALARAWRQHGGEGEYVRVVIRFLSKVRAPDRQYADELLNNVRERLSLTGTTPLQDFPNLYLLGLGEEAFALIEQASFAQMFDPDGQSPTVNDTHHISMSVIYNTWNRGFRQDVRFVGLCAKLGLCDYWVSTGKWPDCADDVPYDFRAEARQHVSAGNGPPRGP